MILRLSLGSNSIPEVMKNAEDAKDAEVRKEEKRPNSLLNKKRSPVPANQRALYCGWLCVPCVLRVLRVQ
jgi:hypothetical protein